MHVIVVLGTEREHVAEVAVLVVGREALGHGFDYVIAHRVEIFYVALRDVHLTRVCVLGLEGLRDLGELVPPDALYGLDGLGNRLAELVLSPVAEALFARSAG